MVATMDKETNIPLDLIKLWQEKTQAFFNDPKTIEIMMKNMQASQDFFKKIQKMSSTYADHNTNETDDSKDNIRDAISILKLRIAALEGRVAELEGNTKGDISDI